MTTNKPEVVSVYNTVTGESEEVVRLSDYEALQAEHEKLRRDAERYRWLRLQVGVQLTGSQSYPASPYLLVSPPAREFIAESTDSAIDDAIAAHRKQGGES